MAGEGEGGKWMVDLLEALCDDEQHDHTHTSTKLKHAATQTHTQTGKAQTSYQVKAWMHPNVFIDSKLAAGDPAFVYVTGEGSAEQAHGIRHLWRTSTPTQHNGQTKLGGLAKAFDRNGLGDFGIVASVWPDDGVKKGEILLSQTLLRVFDEQRMQVFNVLPLKVLLLKIFSLSHTFNISHKVEKCEAFTAHLLSEVGNKVENTYENIRNTEQFLELFIPRSLEGTYIVHGMPFKLQLSGQNYTFRIHLPRAIDEGQMQPVVFLVTSDTKCEIEPEKSKEEGHAGQSTGNDKDYSQDLVSRARERGQIAGHGGYSVLGGIEKERKALEKVIHIPWSNSSFFQKMQIAAPKGVILHGPPGTGKSRLAYAAAKEANATLFVLNGPDLLSEFQGESESGLRALFAEARKNQPSIIFIDEIDAIIPSRETNHKAVHGSSSSDRITAELLTLMDNGSKINERMVVLAATNRIDSLDRALRRPGRFDYEIEVSVPDPMQRFEILSIILEEVELGISKEDLRKLGNTLHGFTGADLRALCNEASLSAIRRLAKEVAPEYLSQDFHESGVSVNMEDFTEAKKAILPSAMREVLFRIPNVKYEDIGGRMELKSKLNEVVRMQTQKQIFANLNVKPLKGILLYGPPGCSKTLLVKAIAAQSQLNFINIKGPELLNKYVGESEKAIKSLFARAKMAAPCIIFIDEIDGLVTARSSDTSLLQKRILTQLLVELDNIGMNDRVAIIGATNRPDKLDIALLRPGRFDWLLYVPPPDEIERKEIFRCLLRKIPLQYEEHLGISFQCLNDVAQHFANRTSGYSPADIAAVIRQAGMQALSENMDANQICIRHLHDSVSRASPSLANLDQELVELYDHFERSTVLRAAVH